jgi:hypothetical protein
MNPKIAFKNYPKLKKKHKKSAQRIFALILRLPNLPLPSLLLPILLPRLSPFVTSLFPDLHTQTTACRFKRSCSAIVENRSRKKRIGMAF